MRVSGISRRRSLARAALFVAVVLTVSYLVATMPEFQDFFVNSDQLTIVSLADDIVLNPKFSPFHWNFSRAPYFFPDLALSLVLRPIIRGDAALAAAVLVIQSAFVAGAGAAISALFARNEERRTGAVALYGTIVALTLLGARHGWSAGAAAWPFVSFSHAGALDTALVGFIALARGFYAAPRRPVALALSLALSLLAYCSDKVAVVLFLPPAALYLLALSRREGAARLLAFAAIQALALAGMVVVDHALNFQITEPNTVAGLPEHLASVARFFAAQPVSLRLYAACSGLVLVLAFARSSAALLGRDTAAPGPGTGLAFLLSCSGIADVLLCLWLWHDDSGVYLRFAIMAEFAGPVLALYLLGSLPAAVPAWRATPAAFVAVVVAALVTWHGTRDPFDTVRVQRRRGAAFAACLARHGLHDGYAAYWTARQLSSSTDWRVQVDQFYPETPVPFFWGSDVAWFFERLRGGGAVHHDFVVLDGLPAEAVYDLYGQPDAVETCGSHKLAIYRDTAELESKVDAGLAPVLAIPSVRRHLPEPVATAIRGGQLGFRLQDLGSLVGRRSAGAVDLSPDDGAGFALFGPYISVEPGLYTVDIAFRCTGDLGGSYFEVTENDGQARLTAWPVGDHRDRCDGGIQHAQMTLDAGRPVSRLEIRAFYGGTGDLTIAGVRMVREGGEG